MTKFISDQEKKILNLLAIAYNHFLALEVQHDSDQREFQTAIHQCQQLITLRIARRACPNIFYNIKVDKKTT